MRSLYTLALLASALLIIGCNTGPDLRYLDASVGDDLELPPDLIRSETESKFELPEVFSGEDESARDQIPVLANVESLRLEGTENFYWLSVEEPVDNLYQLVKNFWASEGYRLTVDEPVIGIMQTEWVVKEVGSSEKKGSWLERLFASDDLSAVQDQYKTRIARDEQDRSRIYIAHRGTEYKYVLDTAQESRTVVGSEGDDDAEWQFRKPDPELEIEMLSRLMIYLGLQQAEVDQQRESVKLFKPRAYMRLDSDENSPFLIIRDAYHIAWNRVYHSLERLNFEVETAQFKTGFLGEGIFTVTIEIKESQKEAGLFSLVSATETDQRKILLILSEETHELTRVNIEDSKGEFDTSPEGAEFLGLLYQDLK